MFKKHISLYLLIWGITFYSCAGQNKKLVFTPITEINVIEKTSSGITNKKVSYLVENYEETDQALREIDAFIEKNKGTDYRDFGTLLIMIYKQSGETNIANITANRRVIDRYSFEHDLLYTYTWSKGQFISRDKYKDGQIVNAKGKVRVIDIPDKISKAK